MADDTKYTFCPSLPDIAFVTPNFLDAAGQVARQQAQFEYLGCIAQRRPQLRRHFYRAYLTQCIGRLDHPFEAFPRRKEDGNDARWAKFLFLVEESTGWGVGDEVS